MNEHLNQVPKRQAELDIVEMASTVWRGRSTVVVTAVACGVVALSVALLLPPVFTARASIMPPQQQSSGLAAALGSLGSLAGVSGSGALKNPSELYVSILRSQRVAQALDKKFGLQERIEAKTFSAVRQFLESSVNIQAAKSGLIEIAVENKDPEFAARLANAFIDELKHVNQSLAVTDASKRRLFFEGQLRDTRTELAHAESELEKLQKTTGLILPEGQVTGVIKATADLEAKIAAKEVQLASMRSFATNSNPDLMRAQEELTALRAQLQQLSSGKKENQPLLSDVAKLPEKGIAYVRAVREVKYQEALLEVIAKQYELARIDEARDSSLIQVLDVAIPPDRKSGPKRLLIVLGGMVLGAVLGMGRVLFRQWRLSKSV